MCTNATCACGYALSQAKQRLQQETLATYHQIRGSHPTDESLSSADNTAYDNDETTDESELFVPAEDKVAYKRGKSGRRDLVLDTAQS